MQKQSFEKLMHPWTAVTACENEGTCEIGVWGRKHIFDHTALPTVIYSGGLPLLNSPIRLVGTENGHLLNWLSAGCYIFEHDNEQAVINGWLQSEASVINTTTIIEYDGLAKIDIKLMARGRTVKQIFGLEPDSKVGHDLSELWLEIPIRREIAQLYHYWPNHVIAQPDEQHAVNPSLHARRDESLANSGELMTDQSLPFKPLVWLGNDRAGLTFCAESDEKWQISDSDKAIEIICTEQEVILRLHLLDFAIDGWEADNYLPRCFTIWVQATPVKPFEDVLGERRSLHIDCFKKVESDYATFLFGPSQDDPNEPVFDRITRLGVNTLFLHEKWNCVQNHWQTNKEVARQTKAIVEEAHSRGIKVIPYFGYELASCAPEWSEYAAKVLLGTKGGWYRQPPQRDYVVCYNSEWADKLVDGFADAVEQFGFDGIYLDSTLFPHGCTNEKHGCGYHGKDGVLHPTYPVMAIRRMMRRLYSILDPKRGIVNPHQSGCVGSPLLSFTHLYWDGEFLQFPLHRKTMKSIPFDYCRSEYVGRNSGVPCEFLVYESPLAPDWTFNNALSLTLPHGVLPRPNDVNGPLQVMSDIWKILKRYSNTEADFFPYWQNDMGLIVSNSTVKVSYYRKLGVDGKPQVLAFICNPTDMPVITVQIAFNEKIIGSAYNRMMNAETGQIIESSNGSMQVEIGAFGHIIAYIE